MELLFVVLFANIATVYPLDVSHSLISDFFEVKNTYALNLLLCSKKEAVQTVEYFLVNHREKLFTVNGQYGIEKDILTSITGHHYKVGIFLDLNCKENQKIFNLVSRLGFFNTSHTFLIYSDHVSDTLHRAVLDSTADLTMVNSENTFYHIQRSRGDYDINTVRLGTWKPNTVLKLKRVPTVRSLDGTTITSTMFDIYHTNDYERFLSELQNHTYIEGEDLPNRFGYELNLHIAKWYNYSIFLITADRWGLKLPNGSLSGALGQVERKEVNTTMGAARYMIERLNVVDPVITTHEFWFMFIFIQPRILGTYKSLFLPLSLGVWISLVLLIIVASITLFIMLKYEKSKDLKHKENISACFLQLIGIFSQQGLTIEVFNLSSRLLCLFLLLMGTIVVILYNGETTNALLSTAPTPIKNIDDLVKSDIKMALVDAFYFTNIQVRNSFVPKKIYEKIDKHMTKTYSLQEGLEMIKQNVAFCTEYFWIYVAIDKYFDEELKCKLSYILPMPSLLVTQYVVKHSHLRELYNEAIIWMKENGLSHYGQVRWFPQKPKCTLKQGFIFVRLESVTIAIAIYFIGLILSIIIFLGELRIKRNRARVRNIVHRDKLRNGKIQWMI
ncbi:uncharacterized protein LOC106667769 isoform X2 [Cimex lectularius]|uniref:Ionotropic glutamate receptor C-terminal domain-containing protein n=1 Tax=Cimex lectularius TaxID=79782 RepID=A0A8I6TI91_CIMLE|nr:uncharacterized protein LOC106667769 isoform X2 [Cimex lectularius]